MGLDRLRSVAYVRLSNAGKVAPARAVGFHL